MTRVGVIIVTHDSGRFLRRSLTALQASATAPDRVVIVDSGSSDDAYVTEAAQSYEGAIAIRHHDNVGFCAANNIGIDALDDVDSLLFLNPDAFVSPGFLCGALSILDSGPTIGAVGPKLLSANADSGELTGLIDSAGIFQTRYGRIYDRGQGEVDRGQHDDGIEDVPALCAAAMLCRRDALLAIADHGEVFDERFFMYKEDVDVSFRLGRAGWRTVYEPSLVVAHCRGWNRATMSTWARRRSLTNEWRLLAKGSIPARLRPPMLGYLVIKSVAVALGR